MIISDWNGTIVEVNPAVCRMFGYTYEEFLGLPPTATVHPDYLSLVAESMQTIQASGQAQARLVNLRKDGTPFPTEVHGTTFTYLGKPHSLGVVRDITERVEAERQLREREEQYRAIFEATSDGLIIADLNGVVFEANPAACSIYGYSYEELLGLSPTALTHPDSLSQVTEDILTIKGGSQLQTRSIGLRKDGTSFYAEVHGTPFTYKGQPRALAIVRDVTKQVHAEEQLREKEEQYRSVFEATTDSMSIATLEGQIVEVNPATCKMYGYTYQEMIGLPPAAIVHPDSFPLLAGGLQTIMAGGRHDSTLMVLRKDGTQFPVEAHATRFTYKGESHLLTIVRDITERVEAERQLREREEQYRGIFEAATDAMFITTLEDGVVMEANPAACKMLGYSYEEIIGLSPAAIVHPDSLSQAANDLQALQAGKAASGNMVLQRKDGTTFPTEGRSTIFAYKGRPYVLAVLRDITERVEAEQLLLEREEQYRSIFESTYDAINIIDLDGFFVEVNPAFCSMFGYTREELIGMHASVTTAPETLPILDDALKTFKTGRNYQTVVAQALCKDGTLFYAESHGTTLTYRGKPHALSVSRDVTEQVRAQQLLEQRVEERTREIASLLEISHTVASTLQLKPLLGLILDQLKTVVDYTGSSILTVEGEELVFLDSRSPTPEEQLMKLRFPLKNLRLIWKTITARESIIIQDVREDTPLARAFRVAMGELGETTFHYVRACLFVPLTLREQVIGMLVLSSSEAQAFTQHHATLALAIANQAAIAIENARLYAQAQELAAVEERQRLARELHDSVSQALYGISLGVHTACLQMDRDPRELAESLDYVLELAEAALIEMRALIFELRPESLETEGLVTALTKQAAAMRARQGVIVQLELGQEPDVPLKVKQDLYRIAQEALHNTVKHARASKVVLRLDQTSEVVVLEVCDNGRGFDATASFPGHLGLHSMQERVKGLGGELQIESVPGQRTCIRAQVPAREAI